MTAPRNTLTESRILAACPFCGSTNIDGSFAISGDGHVNAGCMDCGATGPDTNTTDEAVAIAEWNKRA